MFYILLGVRYTIAMQIYNTRRQRSQPERESIVDDLPPKTPRKQRDTSGLRRKLILFFILLLLSLLSSGFIYLAAERQNRAEQQAFVKLAQENREHQALLKRLAERRIQIAKDGEAIARANGQFDESRFFTAIQKQDTGCTVNDPWRLTVVVNKKNCIVDKNWIPDSLVDVDGFLVRSEIKQPLLDMMQAAATAGVNFELTSSFRSSADQQQIYDERVEATQTSDVDSTSARPGYSEHQTGLSIDVKILDCALDCFGTTRRYQWLKANAANFGFIERYPYSLGEITGYVHEPWHWRYVGKDVALDMKAKGIETLEMYYRIPGGDYYE